MICNVLKEKNNVVIEERAIPEPKLGQVRIKTMLAGICGSDIHALHGLQPSLTFPRVMGHELVGIIDAFNPKDEQQGFHVGDRVAIDPSFRCGKCALCKDGRENICENLEVLGVHCDGGFSQFFICNVDMLHKLPECLRFEEAIFCEPMSIAMHAISRMTSTNRNKVAILGAGPIGLALLVALKELFQKVIVFEVLENRKRVALEIGADEVIDSVSGVYEAEDIDVVFDAVSIYATSVKAAKIVKRGGEVIVVGMAKPDVWFALLPILKKELTIRGTRMTRSVDFLAGLDLLARTDPKKIQAIITGYCSLADSVEGIHFAEKNPDKCIKEVIDCRK